MKMLFFFALISCCLINFNFAQFTKNGDCMMAEPEKEEDCTKLPVDKDMRCCFVQYSMKDDEYDYDYKDFKRCHAIYWNKKWVFKFIEALEDFDDFDLQCSTSYLQPMIALLLFLLIF